MTPGLAVILVGEDPASAVYVRNKVKACGETGIHSVFEKYDATLSEAELLARIEALNADASIHGILVQMPLPRHINPQRVIETISTAKDVDGYSVQSAGDLMAGLPGFRPCTPYGCMKLIETTGIDLKGKHAVVIGRSNTVGKPMALLLLQANATVTICHSGTPDIGSPHPPGRCGGGRRGPAQRAHRRHGQAWRCRDRCRHEPQRRRQAVW